MDAFRFTEVKLHAPLENLHAAISIIQTHILSIDTDGGADVMFRRLPSAVRGLADRSRYAGAAARAG